MTVAQAIHLFSETAENKMIEFNIDNFKRDYPTLYKVIITVILEADLIGYKQGVERAIEKIKTL